MPVRDLLMGAAGASGTPTYVDDVFSTYLYTGTGATQSINNGIDLSDNGGMVWIKDRTNTVSNILFDTVQGATNYVYSNSNAIQATDSTSLTSFNNNGFTLGNGSTAKVNTLGDLIASWTFRKAPKFFDIVQYTGTGSAHAINHSLGSVPGCIIVKEITASQNWLVYHKGVNNGSSPQNYYTFLNTTAAQAANTTIWNNTAPTSTQFTVGTSAAVNASGQTYIAYIFADQAGGFGSTGTDSAIACGNFSGDGSGNAVVNLGWEPQFIIYKAAGTTGDWYTADIMRGWSMTGFNYLSPDLIAAEVSAPGTAFNPTATGFSFNGSAPTGVNYIYIAIRRPDKPPTTGTSVFLPGINSTGTITTGFPVDLTINNNQSGSTTNSAFVDRLRGTNTTAVSYLVSSSAGAEVAVSGAGIGLDSNTTEYNLNSFSGGVYWNFKRAPTFHDVVCYTGTGSPTTINHNLTVPPEMMIVKDRISTFNWFVYNSSLGNTNQMYLNATGATSSGSVSWNSTNPTSTVFSVGGNAGVNGAGETYVAYLFATCAGVSKVGSFTGTGGTQSVACGFGSGGARFILIKRTDSTGDWYVFDSANGLTSSSSPYLKWNSTAAQTTGYNGIYASSGGFTLDSTASSTVNINGGSYIFLAVA